MANRYFDELEYLLKLITNDSHSLKGTREYCILYEACEKASIYDKIGNNTTNEYKEKYELLKEIIKELINNATK